MRLRFLSFFFACAWHVSSFAQSTQSDIEARLLHKPLYLRGLWQDDNLKFDASGSLSAPSATLSFTLSGIEIAKVQLKPDRLLLTGHRVGLIFKGVTPQRVVLKHEAIHLETFRRANRRLRASARRIFTADLADLIPSMLPQWQNSREEPRTQCRSHHCGDTTSPSPRLRFAGSAVASSPEGPLRT